MRGYFATSRVEQWRGRSVYEFLGVRFFKRYFLPTELVLRRLRGGKAMRRGREALGSELRRLEWETKRNEIIHLLAMVLMGCLLIPRIGHLSMAQLVAVFAINLYLNVYPIFLQRYNRFRILNLMNREK